MKLIDLGWSLARFDSKNNAITIVAPSDYSDGIAAPAQTINIHGQTNLLRLRDALNEAYPQHEDTPHINSKVL